ncbi:hypothetical protein C1N89_27165 (plasmid) [Priestia aryabhattai]
MVCLYPRYENTTSILPKLVCSFTKKQGKLAYTNDDVTIFYELKEVYARPEMTLEKAVITVAKKFNLVPDTPPNISTEKTKP